MSAPFLAEVRIFGFNFPPRNWAFCDGQILPINQNQALYSLLGTTYGGDGRVTFALPDLRGRVPRRLPARGKSWGRTLGLLVPIPPPRKLPGQLTRTVPRSKVPLRTEASRPLAA